MGQSNYVHVTGCNVKRTTDKAILIAFDDRDDGMKELWVPRSQIDNEGEHLDAGDTDVTVSITEWFANKEGIEGESQ